MINAEEIYKGILSNRTLLMGVAIIMVIVYHCFCWVFNPIGIFNIGYIGVDIFLFLSGIGLRNSFENNKISKFYFNRFIRIYPIYFVSVILMYFVFTNDWSLKDLIHNLLTTGYYFNGGENRFDWYLESLFTLYIFFPFFFLLRKSGFTSVLILLFAAAICLHFFNISWWYDCLIGRLPIFMYGIVLKNYYHTIKWVSIIGLILYIPCYLLCSRFLAASFLTCPIIIAIITLSGKVYGVRQGMKWIHTLGKYTLEIYIANLFVFQIIDRHCSELGIIQRFGVYFILEIIISLVIIYLNILIRDNIIIKRKQPDITYNRN